MEWADASLSKKYDGVEWIPLSLDSYDYKSTCGAKNDWFFPTQHCTIMMKLWYFVFFFNFLKCRRRNFSQRRVSLQLFSVYFSSTELTCSKLSHLCWAEAVIFLLGGTSSILRTLGAKPVKNTLYRVSQKNALSECCWSHSALAQSPFVGTLCV